MSFGLESTDFEWVEPEELHHPHLAQDVANGGTAANSGFLKEGYLHIMEKLPSKGEDTNTFSRMALKLVRRMSDPSILVG